MKRVFSILLLGCLFICIGGYHLVYTLYKCGIKQEMKTYLKCHADDNNYCTHLSFRLSANEIIDTDFNWEEENAEFRFRGELYDVVTIKKLGDSVRLCAIKDIRENDLEKQVAEIHRKTHSGPNGSRVSFMKFFSAFYFTDHSSVFFIAPIQVKYYTTSDTDFYSGNAEVTIPPPRC